MDHRIELRDVTKTNWLECIRLELNADQKGFMSSNLYSIAQSKFEPCRVPCAICNTQGTMVGFALYNECPLDDGTYRISRLMIDQAYQGHGYGRAAAEAIIARMREIEDCFEILLDYVPSNEAAVRLWRRLGFVDCGREGDNVLAKLNLQKTPNGCVATQIRSD